MDANKIKILICGDVKGNFQTLFSRVETLNKKAGPFEMLLCVGDFFGDNFNEFKQYQAGLKKVPLSTYILGPVSQEQERYFEDINGCEIAPNISYLGKRGLFSPSTGLKIAYLSGIQSDSDEYEKFTFRKQDAMALKAACVRSQCSFRGVDILLTSQWPKFITNGDDNAKVEYNGSDIISWLAVHLKPRYLISGFEDHYFERKPYRNKNKSGDSMEIATRFIALAPVKKSSKEKWLYALSLTPLERMRMTELCQRTTDETDSPFPDELLREDITKEVKFDQSENKQYFYDMNASMDDTKRKRKGANNPFKEKRPKPEFDQSKCWFCLGSPNVEKHLVISVGNEIYLTLAKGGLVSEHVLISPITHFQATVGLSEEFLNEIEQFKKSLVKYFDSKNEVPVFFERNYKTSHLQIQVVPIPKQATRELKEIFIDEANGHGIQLEELPDISQLQTAIPKGVPYFMVELPDKTVLYSKIRNNFPLQFGREVLTSGPILDMPDRIEWQDCKLNETEEIALVQRFRKSFERYDFTLQS
ncbi:CWF19-like protein 1 [Chrysoperla carnea]|uniref:CWF19-like protein 1 n=1 Tax=Chrysoperla carnea TaxID=189513 RepID=UPI001D06A643|nr:CWF19-like protein 1 [Chrysoperla carnea]